MPNKLTDAEIKKALEDKIEFENFDENGYAVVDIEKLKNTLDLINRQEEENESLKAEVERLKDFATSKCEDCAGCTSWKCDCSNIKAEAYKEAFEKVKEELKNIAKIDWQGGYYYLVGEAFFDNLLNELVGDENRL